LSGSDPGKGNVSPRRNFGRWARPPSTAIWKAVRRCRCLRSTPSCTRRRCSGSPGPANRSSAPMSMVPPGFWPRPKKPGRGDRAGGQHIDRGDYAFATCHVDNVVEAVQCALERGEGGRAFFITDLQKLTFREFVAALARVSGAATIAGRPTARPGRFRATCPAPVLQRLPCRWPRVSGEASGTPPLPSCAAPGDSCLHLWRG
jgi:hypothetical protein